MGVAKKGRRRIHVANRIFLWNITDDQELWSWRNSESAGILYVLLTIVSTDKRFLVKYVVGQSCVPEPYHSHLLVFGAEFPGLAHHKRPARLQTPRWENDDFATPGLVRQIIEWSLLPDKAIMLVDQQGQPILSME